MGFKLEKERTGSTPYIVIDEDAGYMKIEGKSFRENAGKFYGDVINWLNGYLTTDRNNAIIVEFAEDFMGDFDNLRFNMILS